MSTLSPERTEVSSRRLGWSLALFALAQLIFSLDLNIVFVALPDIGAALGFTEQTQQWVVSAYVVFAGGFLLLGGRAADLMGRRRMFVLALAVYAVSSLAGGMATDQLMIVIARAAQGIGGALLLPSTLSLINTLFPEGRRRNRALAAWGGAGASGLTLGALLGGVLTQHFGWSAVFLVNVPLAGLVAVAALAVVPSDRLTRRRGCGGAHRWVARLPVRVAPGDRLTRRRGCGGARWWVAGLPVRVAPGDRLTRRPGGRERRRFDLPGALVVTGGLTMLVFALVQGPELGWASPAVLVSAVLAVLLLGAFAVIEARGADPLMPPRLLTNRSLIGAIAVTFLFMGTFGTLPYFLSVLLRTVHELSPLSTGLAFLVPSVAIAAGTQLGERLTTRWGARTTLLAGFGVGAVGTAVLAVGFDAAAGYPACLPGLVISGLAQGTTWTAMWIAAAEGVAPGEQGVASGMASTTLNIGNAVGLAVLIGVANAGVTGRHGEAFRVALAEGGRVAVLLAAVGMLAGVGVAAALPRRREPVRSGDAAQSARSDSSEAMASSSADAAITKESPACT